ncbi:MAG: hypothetical protein IKL66_02120 [Clostridia bacterium]|nr:hypothetical protein [Clostridia bacterium]
MSTYLNLKFNTPSTTNEGLKESLIYIGSRYGYYSNKVDCSQNEYLKGGIAYVAKKFGRFKKNAIRYMIYAKPVKNSSNKVWKFNKNIYSRAYECILKILMSSPNEDRDQVYDMLKKLYLEIVNLGEDVERTYSTALVYWQMQMLKVNSIHKNTDTATSAMKIYNHIKRIDKNF